MIETPAPVKKARYKATIIEGNPRKNPSINESFTSPSPIPLPFVMTNKSRKNARVANPAIRWGITNPLELSKYRREETVETITKKSGIIPYSRSAKNMPIKL